MFAARRGQAVLRKAKGTGCLQHSTAGFTKIICACIDPAALSADEPVIFYPFGQDDRRTTGRTLERLARVDVHIHRGVAGGAVE